MILIKEVKNKYQVYYFEDVDINYQDTRNAELIGEYRTLPNAIKRANALEFELYENDIKLKHGIKLTSKKKDAEIHEETIRSN